MASQHKLLQVNNLQVALHTGANGEARVPVVDGIDFSIAAGETFALLGESGCGKSMTALALLQLLPNNGVYLQGSEIFLQQQNLLDLPEVAMRKIRGRRMAMIFQEPMTSLNPVLTVGEQICEVLFQHFKQYKADKKLAVDRAIELLDQVGIPESAQRFKEYPHQLSGGMKQRVMIAIALAGEPELLIADEPTTALDVTIQAQVLDLLKDMQQKTGMAMLLITHDLGVVKKMADTVGVMYAGQLVEHDIAEKFFAAPKHPYSQKLFQSLPSIDKRNHILDVIKGAVPPLGQWSEACRFADRCPHAWDSCRRTAPKWLQVDGSKQLARCHLYDANIPKPDANKISEVSAPSSDDTTKLARNDAAKHTSMGGSCNSALSSLLKVEDLKIHFPIKKGLLKRTVGHVKAVDGVSFDLLAGKTLALVGESGCGKTTTGRGILKLINVTAGEVMYQGEDLNRLSHRKMHLLRRDIQMIFQDPFSSMNPRMRVRDIIAEGMIAHKLYKSEAEMDQAISKLLQNVGLDETAALRYPHEFSGGQRQRICIARALAVKPKIIICDEPTSALDVSVQAQILNLLRDLQAQYQLSYLFITHNMSVVAYLADEIMVMYQGRIVEHGAATSILTRPQHEYTQKLLAAVPTV